MQYTSECHCGNIKVTACFPHPIEEYQARQCDCDFCTAHGLAYLSDVDGTISMFPQKSLNQLKQGSEQADFWQCSNCKQVIAVTVTTNDEVRGAVSKALFEHKFSLKPAILVSPKKLSPKEKSARWPTMWSKVILNNGSST